MLYLLITILLQTFVASQNLLLIPKNGVVSMFNLETFSTEHNLETVATFDDFSVYSTSLDNFNMFSTTLTDMFDIEEDQTITVNHQLEVDLDKLFEKYNLNHQHVFDLN